MDHVHAQPNGPRNQPGAWRRAALPLALIGAVVIAAIVVDARSSSGGAGVRATRSEQSADAPPHSAPSVSVPTPGMPSDTGPTDTGPTDTISGPTLPAGPTDTTGDTTTGDTAAPSPSSPDAPTLPPGADSAEAALADTNFFVTWLPELRAMGAPDWLHQGTRITYYAAAASVGGSYHQYVEDENGGWINPTTGDRYRQDDIPGASGHGYTQVNVTVLDAAVAVLAIRSYGLTDLDLDSPVVTLTWGGAVGIPGAGADYWLHPAVLAGLEDLVSPSLKIVRMPYSIGGTQYASIWIQSLGESGNFTWVYDEDSGLLLHTASAAAGAPATGPVPAGEGREGSTFLTQSTLVAVRDTTLPWATAAAPTWVGTVDRIEYTGTITVSIAGSPSGSLDTTLTVDRQSSGVDWARYLFSRTIYSTVAPSVTDYFERLDGPGQVGAIFLPPAALARLSAGEELDRDPVTQTVVSVASVGSYGSGTAVTIVESGPVEESELVYDVETGLLLSLVTVDSVLNTRTAYEFSSWS